MRNPPRHSENPRRTRRPTNDDGRSTQRVISTAVCETLESRRLFAVNVLTFHNDVARDGENLAETTLTPANVNPTTFGKLFEYPVDGQVYAQPLVDTNVAITGKGTHDVVFVATEHDSVYAFDADSNAGTNALPLWSRSFTNPSAGVTTIPYLDTHSGDIEPEIGITSTPVIDPTTNTMYVVVDTKEVVNGVTTYYARLHALDLSTGADKFGGPVVLAGSVAGTGAGSVNGTVAFQALWGNQRPALTLYNGVLYIAFAAHGDQGPYHGWIMAYAAGTLKQLAIFNTTPNGKGAGIWMSGSGLSIDSEGHIIVSTANGDFNGGPEWGDSVLELSLGTSGFSVTDSFTPYNQAYLSSSDQDLGSGGVLVLPTQPGPVPHEGVLGGKQGTVYLVNLDNLGGYSTNGSDSQIVQSITGVVSRVFCALCYFNGAVYLQGVGGSLMKFSLTNGKLSTEPVALAVHSYGYPGATPSISANGNSNGIIWMVEDGSPAELHALDAGTLTELYNSNMEGVRDQPTSAGVKFTPPTVANGKVYVPTAGGLAVYGLFPTATKAPAAPSGLAVVATSSSTIDLSFFAADNTETGFEILRSTDGTNFTRVNVLPAGVTSYTDENLNPSTKYYYKLEADNTAGTSAASLAVSATTFAQANLTGIVGYWRMDEANGATLLDSSPTGQAGNIVGETTRVAGIVGPGALSFHGTGLAISQAQMLDVPAWNFTASQSFTVGAWIDPERLISTEVGVVAKSFDKPPGYGIYINAANQWEFGGTTPIDGSTVTLNWQYVTIVQDAAAGKRYLYVNGVLEGTGAAQDASGTGDLWLGSARDSYVYFPGMIDDVRIYDLALTQSQIVTIVGETNPNPPTLVSVVASSSTQAILTWNEPTGNSGGTATGFTIQQLTSSGSYTNIGEVGATATTFTATRLTPGSIDTFRVLAVDAVGNEPSGTLTVTMPNTNPVTGSVTGTVSQIVGGVTSAFPGVTVFLDTNNNGILDAGELSAVTSATGTYSINAIVAGTHNLRQLVPSNYTQTTPATNPTPITLTAGQNLLGENFVDTQTTVFIPGSIAGIVFNDANGNGTQDVSEAGITGVELYLDLKDDGTLDTGDPITTTQTSGIFTFSNLAAGTYRVREVLPAGQNLTAPAAGYYDVTIASNSQITGKNFGNKAISTFVPGTISGTVFNDANGNGILDTGEAGITGATLYLDLKKDGTLDSGDPVVSTVAGAYTFTNLVAGTYRVREQIPAGETLTAPAAGYFDVTITSNSQITGVNFGDKSNSISGIVFNDTNGNGKLDAGETGITGVKLFVDLQLDGTLDTGDPTAISNASGAYTFTNLAAGTYRVREILPAGHKFTSPAAGYYDLTITANSQLTGENFGNAIVAGTASIGGTVFNDVNGNGKFDSGERGLAGVTIYIDANKNGILDTGETSNVTAANGSYLFSGLQPGIYRIREIVPTGYTQTSSTYTAIYYDVTLGVSTVSGTKNFGNKAAAVVVSSGNASISGFVFADTNSDGKFQSTEKGIAGVTIYIDANNNGQFDTGETSTNTTANGSFTFAGLTAGIYVIREVVPTGKKLTTVAAYQVTLPAGYNATAKNFGNV